jgi:hypothetical protein
VPPGREFLNESRSRGLLRVLPTRRDEACF